MSPEYFLYWVLFVKRNSEDEIVFCQWAAPAEQDERWVLSF